MNKSLQIPELIIAIAIKQHNPTILTPDFLKYSGIVPSDWELARPPILTNSAAQVIFANGVNIVAEVNRIIFSEPITTKASQEVAIGAIALKYIEKLAQLEYQGIGINFRGFALFNEQNQTARNYIFGNLLKSGAWQEFGTSPVQAAMRFNYTLEGVQLYLDVNEVGLESPDKKVIPAILFSANFSRAIAGSEQSQRLAQLTQVINNWQTDLTTYQELVNTKFLNFESYQLNLVADNQLVFPQAAV